MAAPQSVLPVISLAIALRFVTNDQPGMKTRVYEDWPEGRIGPVWLTIGNFDGVHLGHQALIGQLIELAAQDGAEAVVMSFQPHPRLLFNPETQNFLLDTYAEKLYRLKRLEPDAIIKLPFTWELARLDARAFLALLTQHLELKGLIVGQDFALGRDREGSADTLKALCDSQAIAFVQFPDLSVDGERVSSGLARRAVQNGEMEKALGFLGHPYAVHSRVREGKHLGSRLGFPTANQIVEASKLLPKFGVYATWASLHGKRYMGVTSVGVRPTVENDGKPNVETWILDFDGNIYGEELCVEFIHFLRDEKKFETIEAMIVQIKQDAIDAREELAHAPRP